MATVNMRINTKTSNLNIRKGPSESFPVVGTLAKGSTVAFTSENSNGWHHLANGKGWCYGLYLVPISTDAPPPSKTPDTPKDSGKVDDANSIDLSKGLDKNILNMLYTQTKNSTNKVNGSVRLFGCPHQFLSSTDFRLNTKIDLGRKYIENIMSEAPIVYFIPGKPSYLPDLDAKQKAAFTAWAAENQKDADNRSVLDDILKEQGDIKYFDFVPDYATYIRYVNTLCRMCAVYLGIGDENMPGTTTKLKHYDWGTYKYKNDYKVPSQTGKSLFEMVSDSAKSVSDSLFGVYQFVQFYCNPSGSFSDSVSNSTTQSKLDGAAQGAEGLAKEAAFVMDAANLQTLQSANEIFAEGLGEIADKTKNDGFMKRFLSSADTIVTGGNIIFPEIWTEAQYNRASSSSIVIDLVSPYGGKMPIYLNVLVPIMHILALSTPHQLSANAYSAPFMVKVFAKGWYSCELGVIDSVQIEKGNGGDSWSVDSLPTEAKVTISVKDLYSNLMVTPSNKPGLFFSNQGLIEFLAVTCGVDLTKPNFMLRLDAMFASIFNKVQDIPANLYRDVVQSVRNQVEKWYKL